MLKASQPWKFTIIYERNMLTSDKLIMPFLHKDNGI
jgi:hypothetical protein